MTEIRLTLEDLSEETLDRIKRDIQENLESNSVEELERARVKGIIRKIENFK